MAKYLNAEDDLRSDLAPTERLVWAGRPKQGIMFRKPDLFIIPFSVVWTSMAVAGFSANLSDRRHAPGIVLVITSIFVLIGLYLIAGRFWSDMRRRKKTLYGITNERVIIRTRGLRGSLQSVDLGTLSNVSLTENRNGTGTIVLGPQVSWDGWNRSWPGMGSSTPAFEGIDDAKRVFDILRKAQKDV